MNYASVCDGIGAAHVAWQPLGWACQWTSEIEPFPAAVVEQRYGLPNLGDMTAITEEMLDAPVELLVGGTPCQSFSVAGLRGGLADPRGNLALRFIQLAAVLQPEWIVWENVPGVLSSGKGRDFGTFLGGLAELGYGFAYRVLDAQWFGVAQRRRRVFVVGHLGDWRRAAAVLFERESVFGDSPTRRAAGEETTGTIAGCSNGGGANGHGRTADDADTLIAFHPVQDPISSTDGSTHSMGCGSKQGCCTQAVAVRTANTSANGHGVAQEVSHTIDQVQGQAVAFKESQSGCRTGSVHATLDANKGSRRMEGVLSAMAVRRLTPRECERLQGFPDDYTLVTYRNKPAADGPRYKALGNSMAVPVMRWIGQRIAQLRRPAAEPLRQG
jgi:DNA (cytosine-5)-methyltransferase 1